MTAKHLRPHKKATAIIIAIALLIAFAVGGTTAYIVSISERHENVFTPAKVSCLVEETFENGVKSDVSVKNTGNVDAFIRAALVATWVSEEGKILSSAPIEGTDFSVVLGSGSWIKGSDGFYYYKTAVEPDSSTQILFTSVTTVTEPPEGYKLSVQILASAIQSNPEKVVEEAWNVIVKDSNIAPY